MKDDIGKALVAGMVLPAADQRRGRNPRAIVALAFSNVVCRLSPSTIRKIFSLLAMHAAPATYDQAEEAVLEISQHSQAAAGRFSCLRRSIASALLLRMSGRWPTWSIGVPRRPPFRAHAWIEAENRIVAELGAPEAFSRLICVPPRERSIRQSASR